MEGMLKNQEKKVKESVADAKQVKVLEAKISSIQKGQFVGHNCTVICNGLRAENLRAFLFFQNSTKQRKQRAKYQRMLRL